MKERLGQALFVVTHPRLAISTKYRQQVVPIEFAVPPHTATIEEFPKLPLYDAMQAMRKAKEELKVRAKAKAEKPVNPIPGLVKQIDKGGKAGLAAACELSVMAGLGNPQAQQAVDGLDDTGVIFIRPTGPTDDKGGVTLSDWAPPDQELMLSGQPPRKGYIPHHGDL